MAVDYTLAETVSTRIPKSPRLVRGAPQLSVWPEWLPPMVVVGSREAGSPVTEGRSSWVRRLTTAGGDVFVKTYEYATWASRFGNLGRWTRPGTTSRAAREFDALTWMRDHGLPAPEPVAVVETRTFRFLQRAVLVTAAFAGEPASRLLPTLEAAGRRTLAMAIGRLVERLHRLGFEDRNLDLRNLLAKPTHHGWVVAKIDSPRHRLTRAPLTAARAAADWARLLPQLEPFGLAAIARDAAGQSDDDERSG